ncbi:MAG: PQQ-binding-like beta-propeller repeat protein [Planctomycetes bacterium]|nr:PQQ-binding-like beta-propeller repeat protein [Planctomycetota bacterium]
MKSAGRWCVVVAMLLGSGARGDSAGEVIDASGVKGGVVVHLGCGDGQLTAALRASDRYIVQGLDTSEKNIAAARANIRKAGSYGNVSAATFDGKRLPYVDHFVNLLVVSSPADVSRDEMMRVLVPGGVACIGDGAKWKKIVKPWPGEMDQWTHYMHDPQGTCVGLDTLVGPPRRLKWVGSPRHARSHEHTASLHALVSAAGRNFDVMDAGSRASIQLPARYVLTARDAFNGTILWRREIPNWFNHLFPLKAGPATMPRRLVAVDQTVYVSGGLGNPLLALDAATGQVVHEYKDTATTVDIILSDGVLFVVVEPDRKPVDYKQESAHCWTESSRANRTWGWAGHTQTVKAISAESGKLLWQQKTKIAPMTLTVDDQKVCFFDGQSVVAYNRTDGKKRWTSPALGKDQPLFVTGFAPKLIIHGDTILYSPSKRIVALDGTSGEILWDVQGKPRSGHHSPEDLFVIDDLVWAAGTAGGRGSTFVGYDLKTGEKAHVFPNEEKAFYMHQRCYPGRATVNYLIPAATGTEFVDLQTGQWEIHHWVRGGCIYGMMPANGMIYATPQACACYYQSKLNGFNALAAGERSLPERPENRLTKGPAYKEVSQWKSDLADADWPVFRQNNTRSGSVATEISSDPKAKWTATLGGRVSQPVVADGRMFIAAIDEHTVYALDTDTGESLWSFTAGGRVDSPPTIYRGMTLFGSADGCVYALCAADGRLAWKFRAAPIDEKLMSYEQIESVWPVHGSVLVQGGVLYAVAGRSMFVDGGLRMLRIDPASGKLLSENVMGDKIPGTENNLQTIMQGKHLPVALPDILSSDGRYVYMKSQTFDMKGRRTRVAPQAPNTQEGEERHLFTPISFLDDSWFHRAYWILGRSAGEGWAEWQVPPKIAHYGRIMSFDEESVYAYGRDPELLCNSSVLEYRLYSAKKDPEVTEKRRVASPSVDWKKLAQLPEGQLTTAQFNWKTEHPPLLVRAMVLAGDTLLVAGPPDVVDEKEMWGRSNEGLFADKMQLQAEALDGKQGAILWGVSSKDGKKLFQKQLDYLPAFDGMIAARGKVFVTTTDGKVVCYE